MSRPRLLRRSLAAAVLPLAMTSLVACGSDDTNASDSSSSSSSGSSSGSDESLSSGDSVEPADFVDRFQNGFDHTDTAHETMKVGGSTGSITGEGDVDYTTDTPSMEMTMGGGTGGDGTQVILVDQVMYIAAPGLSGGKKYMKMDLNDPNSPLGELGSQLDPQAALESFGKGIESVTYGGDDGGLDKYEVTVDTKKMLAQMGETGDAAAQSGMPKQLTYDVWLDDQDRVTKMTMDLGDQIGTMEMTLSDFGKDVSIEAPPADQVGEMPSMPSMPSS